MRAFIGAGVLSLFTIINAAQVNVTVGANSSLTYQPSSVTAERGDVITFHFVSKNHTVTQSSFANPCTPLNPGVNSGFRPANTTSHQTFNFTVTNTSASVWFYCAQTGHCVNGMVFAVNPTPERSFDAFQAKAKSLNPNSTTSSSSASRSASPTGTGTSATPSSSEASAIRLLGETSLGIMTAVAVMLGLVL